MIHVCIFVCMHSCLSLLSLYICIPLLLLFYMSYILEFGVSLVFLSIYIIIYFFMHIDILLGHFLFLYSYLACIRQTNLTWATEKLNSINVNRKQEKYVLIFVLRSYPQLYRNKCLSQAKVSMCYLYKLCMYPLEPKYAIHGQVFPHILSWLYRFIFR